MEKLSADETARRMAAEGGKGFAGRRATRRPAARSAEDGRTDTPAADSTEAASEQAAERARQALSGLLLQGGGEAGPSIPIDEKAFRERLGRMSEDELLRMANFLSVVRAHPADGAAAREPSVVKTAEDELAARGLNLSMSGKTNTVYVSGPGSTWTVTAPVDGEADAPPERAGASGKNSRWIRNNWGQALGRSVKGFIRGY